MQGELREWLVPLLLAWAFGAFIGLERSSRGRPAGFRTHALVALSSAMLMLLTTQQQEWVTMMSEQTLRADPTRVAQGIMTGIGFLGAGVIFKEGINMRGLTTAASIWATAAIGILVGAGLRLPAAAAALITFGTLSIFHWVEARLPAQHYSHLTMRFSRERVLGESQMRDLLRQTGYEVTDTGYSLGRDREYFEYRMIVRTLHLSNREKLAERLDRLPELISYRLSRTGY